MAKRLYRLADLKRAILAGFCVLAALFIHFLVPETKGRSLEQIEADLRKRVTVGS